MSKNSEEFEDLKNLLLSESDGYEVYNMLMDSLGMDPETFTDNNVFSKIDLEYISETGKELSYSYPTDSGFDLYSSEEINLPPFGRALVPTGIKFNLPEGYEIQVRSKSGLAINQGLMVLNSPGTVDQGYTGEIKVIVFNVNNHEVLIHKGMKIAQCVIASCVSGKFVNLIKVKEINPKDRNNNGFGSTGI
jgi:dUTP pyrophosphatase